MYDVDLIKQRINCVDYAIQNNLPIKKSGDRCISPLRAGAKNPTSFIVYNDFWYDFGLAQGGDVIDLAALLNFSGDKGKAIYSLAQATGCKSENSESAEWVQYTQNLCNKIQAWHEALTDSDREYIHKRGITDKTIERIKIGRTENGRLSFPYLKNGYVAYYITRSMQGGAYPESKYMKAPKDDYNDHCPWGLHTLTRDTSRKLLVIAEGMFDILSFEQEGYCCLSAITGHFSKYQLPQVLSICKTFDKVFLVYDNDVVSHAGEKFTLKMAKILIENRIPCLIGTVPKPYKDISEYYEHAGDLQYVIDTAQDGIQFMASQYTELSEFETYARSVCRYMSAPQVDVFFESISNAQSFPQSAFKQLWKDCKKPPNDEFIAREILAKHKLLFNPAISFFEFNGKFWDKKTDQAIERYIQIALGAYATGQKLSSILRLVKASTATNILFNINPVVNFINGTLSLTDGLFREWQDTDYCTYCLDYPYDKNARCSEWVEFLNSITDYDDKKICLLQELSGYVLYPDNRLQKCAVLIGSGANGKSVFLNVLSKIFGSQNVSNVEMSSLAMDFQAIQLQSSMLNISAETRTNVNGAESRFKQIVAGDEISACYKGKDYINFRPRSKMFLACNEYVKSSDTTEGWTRRFCFVNFPIHFVENPDENNPEERLVNRDIESQLTQSENLSAIFNWVYQGYQLLKACGYFTEPDDQKEITEEFKTVSNPVIEFAQEVFIGDRISNEDLYYAYKEWCENNGHTPSGSYLFQRRISQVFREYRKDLEGFRTNKSRGWQKKFDCSVTSVTTPSPF